MAATDQPRKFALRLALSKGRELFLQHARRSRSTGGVRKATQTLYAGRLDDALGYFERQRVKYWNQVDATLLDKYALYLEERGNAPKTVVEKVKLMMQVKRWLIEAKLLTGCEPIKMTIKRSESERHYCWKTEEVQAMLEFCKQDTELSELHDVIACLAYTGLRISELASLRWTDIDFGQELIHLTDESGYNRANGRHLKNGRSRSVPISADLRPILEQRARTSSNVFGGARGGKLGMCRLRKTFATKVIDKPADRFPTPEGEQGFKKGRFHSFRHYFISQCANQRIPEQVVMEWAGHAASEMVRHYYHLHDSESRKYMNQLNLLGRSVGTSGSAREIVHCEGDASVAT